MLNNTAKTTLCALTLSLSVTAQDQQPTTKQAPVDNYGGGLKINLDETGNKYVRFIVMNQIWARYGEHNPNSLINGEQKDQSIDIGIRRSRFITYSQISDRFLILTHFGINNQSFSSGGNNGSSGTGANGIGKKPGLFIHDAYVEYAIVPDFDKVRKKKNPYSLYMGSGLHVFNGISRLTSASTLNFVTLDAPVVNWTLIENSDQFGRQMGIYAKGNLQKASYTFSISKPFATNITPQYHPTKGSVAVDNNGDSKLSVQSYVDYQFFDKESNVLPFRVGTYLGDKKILNIGAGFYHNTEGTQSVDMNGVIAKHDINLFGVDLFTELPLGHRSRKSCINFLATYYNYDFGPNYNRSLGIMNISSGLSPNALPGTSSIQGAGNSKLMLGSGQFLYTQLGYLVPRFSTHQRCQLMPFVANTYSDIKFVDQASNYFDIGVNVLLNGHHSKITAQYSSRPVYFDEGGKYLVKDRKGEFVVQFQVFL